MFQLDRVPFHFGVGDLNGGSYNRTYEFQADFNSVDLNGGSYDSEYVFKVTKATGRGLSIVAERSSGAGICGIVPALALISDF